MLFEPRQLLLDRAFGRFAVQFADFANILDNIHPRLLSRFAPSMHEHIVNLQAETRGMAVLVARDARAEGGYVARITIDNAAKLNTINRALAVEIVETIQQLEDDLALRLVILTGAGERAFVGGADLNELAHLDHSSAARVHHADPSLLRRVPPPRGAGHRAHRRFRARRRARTGRFVRSARRQRAFDIWHAGGSRRHPVGCRGGAVAGADRQRPCPPAVADRRDHRRVRGARLGSRRCGRAARWARCRRRTLRGRDPGRRPARDPPAESA